MAGAAGNSDGITQEVRKACRQFAMQYFHFCRVLREQLGEEKALSTVGKALFQFSLDRTDALRAEALSQGMDLTVENFHAINDLSLTAWSEWQPAMGGVRCPYAETWLGYFGEHPWFKAFACLYCDVVDTTNIENFTRTTSHRITRSLLRGDISCQCEYFPSQQVAEGTYTYGQRS